MKLPLLTTLFSIICISIKAQLPSFNLQPELENNYVCYNTNAVINANIISDSPTTYNLKIKVGDNFFDTGYFGNVVDNAISISLNNYTSNNIYKVIITNSIGSVESSEFAVTASPIFTVQPQSQTQCYDNAISFYVDNFDASNYSFQWQKSENGASGSYANISLSSSKYKNAGTNTLSINEVKTTDNDFFQCVVTHKSLGCTNTSNAATLAINYFGTIQPTATNPICEGDTVNFSTSGIDGTVNSFNWSALNSGNIAISGLSVEEISSTSFKIKGIPTSLNKVALDLTFTNSLMQANGSSMAGTCQVNRFRDAYVVNPKPTGPSVTKLDSVCGEGSMNLTLTDARNNWSWSDSKYGSVLSNSTSLNTSSLTNSKYYYVWHTDVNGCKSNADSVLAKVNPLPEVSLSSIDDICPGATSFNLPYTNLSEGADVFSMTLKTGNIGFTSISDSKGFMVQHKWTNERLQNLELDSDLKSGVYILKILDLNGNHCEWKMVKNL